MRRRSLLPFGCAAVVKSATRCFLAHLACRFATAWRPSGSKLPRHGKATPVFSELPLLSLKLTLT